jgi:hypothetical protein
LEWRPILCGVFHLDFVDGVPSERTSVDVDSPRCLPLGATADQFEDRRSTISAVSACVILPSHLPENQLAHGCSHIGEGQLPNSPGFGVDRILGQ